MRVVGIDEAGYGPLLGPLVVASVTLELERYDAGALWDDVGRDLGIADSKTVLSHRAMATGEATVIALLAAGGLRPRTRAELLGALCLEPPDLHDPSGRGPGAPVAGAPCTAGPGRAPRACEPDPTPLPRWGGGPGRERLAEVAERLAAAGVTILRVRAVAPCPGRLNRAFEAGVGKGTVDFRLLAHLLRAEVAAGGAGAAVFCDKLGGRSHYEELLRELGPTTVLEESRAASAYQVAGVGRVELLRSAEAAHLPVAMASMVAKLVREHELDSLHAMLRDEAGPSLRSCSGYHDPVTRRYVETTADARRAVGLPDRCFLRER